MQSAEEGERAGEKGESRTLTALVPSCSQKEPSRRSNHSVTAGSR